MKRFFALFAALMLACIVSAYSEEKVLLSSSTTASLGDGIEYAQNFLTTSQSGYFKKSNLKALEPSDKGFRALAGNVPRDATTSYLFEAPYPSFVNKDNSGNPIEGAGFIENVGAIKTIIIKDAILNRPYDELFLQYSTSPNGEIHSVKLVPFKADEDGAIIKNAPVVTMEKIDFIFENANYNDNVKTREIKADPALGADANGIYFRGLRVKTNPAYGNNEYSAWSITYFKEIVVTYDLRFTPEQWNMRKELLDEWKIDDGSDATIKKSVTEIKHRKALESIEAEKMHKEQ